MRDDEGRGRVHVWPVRVYYEDTDAAGIVYYANYLKFVERARTELLRDSGIDHSRLLAARGLTFAVRDCAIDYIQPARLDDALEVHTRVLELSGAAVRIEQTVRRDAEILVRVAMRIVCLRDDGRPARLPAPLREAVGAYRAA